MNVKDQIKKGSTETLILALVSDRPMYGYELTQELKQRSNGYFEMKEGLLYPTLHRMEKEGLIKAEWQTPESGRKRKYYALTAVGKEALGSQKEEWRTFMTQMQELLG